MVKTLPSSLVSRTTRFVRACQSSARDQRVPVVLNEALTEAFGRENVEAFIVSVGRSESLSVRRWCGHRRRARHGAGITPEARHNPSAPISFLHSAHHDMRAIGYPQQRRHQLARPDRLRLTASHVAHHDSDLITRFTDTVHQAPAIGRDCCPDDITGKCHLPMQHFGEVGVNAAAPHPESRANTDGQQQPCSDRDPSRCWRCLLR